MEREKRKTNRNGLQGKPKGKRIKIKKLRIAPKNGAERKKFMSSVISANKTYHIMNARATTRRLNLYSSGSASNGMNVVLYMNDTSNEQKWYFDGDRLYPETNRNYCLDRYTASAYLDNADIWKASASDAAAQLVDVVKAGDYCNIRLRTKVNGEYYYLTAVGDANGSGNGKSTASKGNVYWAPSLGSSSLVQKWMFTEVDGSSSGGGETGGTPQKLVGPYVYSGITNDYQSAASTASCSCYPYSFHYGTDFGGRKDTNGTKDTTIKASGRGVVVDKRDNNYSTTALGQTLVVKYDNALNKNGVKIGDVYFRYCHLASIEVEKNEIVSASTVLGERGHSGTGCPDNQPHLHLEATTNPNAKADNSPSEKGGSTDSEKFDVRNVLYTKTSTTGIGKRECMVDHDSPFNSNIYCSHGNAWYSLASFPSYDGES